MAASSALTGSTGDDNRHFAKLDGPAILDGNGFAGQALDDLIVMYDARAIRRAEVNDMHPVLVDPQQRMRPRDHPVRVLDAQRLHIGILGGSFRGKRQ
jgi:hypothetical protein